LIAQSDRKIKSGRAQEYTSECNHSRSSTGNASFSLAEAYRAGGLTQPALRRFLGFAMPGAAEERGLLPIFFEAELYSSKEVFLF
jgi:hypothetical protein